MRLFWSLFILFFLEISVFSQEKTYQVLKEIYGEDVCLTWLPWVILKADSSGGKELNYFMDYLDVFVIKDTSGIYFPEKLWIEIEFISSMGIDVNDKEDSKEVGKWMDKCYRMEVYYSLKYGDYVNSFMVYNPKISRYKVYEGWINFLDWWKYECDVWYIKSIGMNEYERYVDTRVVVGAVPFRDLLIEKKIHVAFLDSCEFKWISEYREIHEQLRYYLNQIIIEVMLYDEAGSLRCRGEYTFPVSGYHDSYWSGWSEW